MNWTTYVIMNKSTRTCYKGSCKDFEKRLREHNAGRVRSTKAMRPWTPIHLELFDNKTAALKRERFFKTRSGHRWLKEHVLLKYGEVAEWPKAAVC